MQTMKINYDHKYDTLYVAIADKTNSYGDDSTDGIILMRDMDTDVLTGFTIMRFLNKYRQGTLPPLPPEIHCSFERDIIPHLI